MIDPGLATVATMAVVGGLSLLISRSAHQRRVRAWLRALTECGVQELTHNDVTGFPTRVSGVKDGLDVSISRCGGRHSHGRRIEVSGLFAVADLHLQTEDFGTSFWKGLGTREVEVGDPGFDSLLLIEGPAPLALAILDAHTRRLVGSVMGGRTAYEGSGAYRWLDGKAELSRGTLTIEFPEGFNNGVDRHLPGVLASILALAANLAARRDVPRQLAENALKDPLWAVRLANLRTLARDRPADSETSRMLRAALADRSEEIRLSAALALGPAEGDATLLELASGGVADGIAARAIVGLGTRIATARAVEGLSQALEAGRLETACSLLDVLSRLVEGAATGTAEPLLIRAVAHDDATIRFAAARALGRSGTVGAVVPLQEAAERFGGDMLRVSRQAVAQIQARARGATPGQLSLAEQQAAGAVSLARDVGGEVSLPGGDGPPAGQS